MKYCSFDIETTGLNPYTGDRIFSFCIGHLDTGEIDVYRRWTPKHKNILQDFFSDLTIVKIAHNYKFELSFIKTHGIDIPKKTVWHDTMIMHQMLNNLAVSHRLNDICWTLGYMIDTPFGTLTAKEIEKRVQKQAKARGMRYDRVDKELFHYYQIADGEMPLMLFKIFYDELKKNKKMYADYRNDIELVKVTEREEEHGLMVDKKAAENIIFNLENDLNSIYNDTFDMFKEFINLNSPVKVANLLYDKLGMPIIKYTEGDNPKPSTEKDVLFKLYRNADKKGKKMIDMVLKQRSYVKGVATIQSYIDLADSNNILHPNIKTNHDKTGREACEKPNLQNVSTGYALKNKFPILARKCFIPFPDHVLYFKDYQGIEMRLGIQGTKSKRLIELLYKDYDFHDACAESFYGDRYTKEKDKLLKKSLRSAAKNGRFLMFYGGGIAELADTLMISIVEAAAGKEKDKKEFPEFYAFMGECYNIAKRNRYIETYQGRLLEVPRDRLYAATDYIIQGSATGVIKRAQVRLDRMLQAKYSDKIRMVLPVHDEIVFSTHKKMIKYEKEYMKDIDDIMIDMKDDGITVPLKVETKKSYTNWNDAEEL